MKRTILLIILITQGLLIDAQTIKNPQVSARSDSAGFVQIEQIELTGNSTTISFIVILPKGTTIMIPSDTYIIPSEGGEKLFVQRATGITLDQAIKEPRGGKLSFKLVFPGIEKNVTKIDYRAGNGGSNWHFFEINIDPEWNKKPDYKPTPDRGIIVKNGKPWKYINNPGYTAKSDNSFRISRVEMADTATVLYFEISRMTGNWVYIPADSYIQSSDGGDLLYVTAAEGTSTNEEIWLEDTGMMTYKLYFPPIDKSVKKINFKELSKSGNMSVFEIDVSMD
jgi:hypothetical protein